MTTKQILSKSKKSALLNNTAPGNTKADMDRLAQRWIEILFDQLQSFKNCELPGAIPINSLDNKYKASP